VRFRARRFSEARSCRTERRSGSGGTRYVVGAVRLSHVGSRHAIEPSPTPEAPAGISERDATATAR
jgi:hypothetical protein